MYGINIQSPSARPNYANGSADFTIHYTVGGFSVSPSKSGILIVSMINGDNSCDITCNGITLAKFYINTRPIFCLPVNSAYPINFVNASNAPTSSNFHFCLIPY